MWRRVGLKSQNRSFRWYTRQAQQRQGGVIEDEGDWAHSHEWWGTNSNSNSSSSSSSNSEGHTLLRSTSHHGNGLISVVSHPCSRPDPVQWTVMERWLQHRYASIHSQNGDDAHFRVLGYQWRVLRFNDFTRQSTVKIMAACRTSDPASICIMQQPHILAVPYLKSMMSVGLTTLASSGYDLRNAIHGEKTLQILCIGHGGGSLPLFLATKIQGSVVHVVEIDPLVISASVEAMGFPAFTVMKPSDERALAQPEMLDEVLWKGTHERLSIYQSDAEKFILDTNNVYDLVFIDAYDGDDIFPHQLWDPKGPFLETLRTRLHPDHGTVVVNLHADYDMSDSDEREPISFQQLLPMSKYVSQVCQAYKEILLGGASRSRGVGFIASVPWLCNASLVVSRGFDASGMNPRRDWVLSKLVSKSLELEDDLNLPFSCLEYIKKGFVLID